MVLSDKSLLLTLLLLVVVVEDAILNGNVVDGLECTEDTTNERLDRGEVMAKQRTMDVNAVNTAALLGMFVDVPFVRSLIGRQKEFIASHTHTRQVKKRETKNGSDPKSFSVGGQTEHDRNNRRRQDCHRIRLQRRILISRHNGAEQHGSQHQPQRSRSRSTLNVQHQP